jgi:hypothetical protein
MKKLASAREAILKSPLKISADKLLTFAEKGTVKSWRCDGNHAFMLTYTAHLIVTDYTGAPQDLFFVALDWLHRECTDAAEDAIRFHVDIIDHKSADISLAIDITEIVAAPTATGGKVRLTPVADPDAQGFDMGAFFAELNRGADG